MTQQRETLGQQGAAPDLLPEQMQHLHRMREVRAGQILEDAGAILTNDHFVLTSGKHASGYINKDAAYPHTEATRELCRMWAEDFAGQGIDVVVGPAMGAIILANNTASELTTITGRQVFGVYAEKVGEGFAFTRGYEQFIRGKRVLIVEDILTTGGSVKKVVDLVNNSGGQVVGVGVLANRGGVKPEDIGVDEIDALVTVEMDSWEEEECRLCIDGVQVNTRVGKGREFLERKATK